jgi:hypothetical protein
MEDKITKELVLQLKRIADALETSNKNSAISEKRTAILEKLQEKQIRAGLRESKTPEKYPQSPSKLD